MFIQSPGWHTSIALLGLMGHTIDHRDDHIVVTAPTDSPPRWGQLLFITEAGAQRSATYWRQKYQATFHNDSWITLGLDCAPAASAQWATDGLNVGATTTLVASNPRQRPLIEGYETRTLTTTDWQNHLSWRADQPSRHLDPVPQTQGELLTIFSEAQCELAAHPQVHWLGAFFGRRLAADVAVVVTEHRAQIYRLFTEYDHRRRDLAGHLLGAACDWAKAQGATEFLLRAEPGTNAGRIAGRMGFDRTVAECFVETLDIRAEGSSEHRTVNVSDASVTGEQFTF